MKKLMLSLLLVLGLSSCTGFFGYEVDQEGPDVNSVVVSNANNSVRIDYGSSEEFVDTSNNLELRHSIKVGGVEVSPVLGYQSTGNGLDEKYYTLPNGGTVVVRGTYGNVTYGYVGGPATVEFEVCSRGRDGKGVVGAEECETFTLTSGTTDMDNDGIADFIESGVVDTDGDGQPDNNDVDSDGDGIVDSEECSSGHVCVDTDNDGIADYLDGDSDGDGVTDALEYINDAANCSPVITAICAVYDGSNTTGETPTVVDASGDSDGDGIADAEECPTGRACSDLDNDGIPDYMDTDSDGDGTPDATENQLPNDADMDGILDAYESDTVDTDGDGQFDVNDVDSDGDGIDDAVECPNGHVCPDTDMDGIPDQLDKDSNGDGVKNSGGTDAEYDSSGDSDGDGVSDDEECPTGFVCADNDNDGTPDYMDPDYPVAVPNPSQTYTVGGTISGLTGSLTLLSNLGEALTITADGTFEFIQGFADGTTFTISPSAQPAGQSCIISNNTDTGTIAGADVSSLTVQCFNATWLTQFGDTTKDPDFVGADNGGDDICRFITTDTEGNVYCAGYTGSSMAENNAGNTDAVVIKIDGNGNLVWMTQFGDTTKDPDFVSADNSGEDVVTGISIDAAGNVYGVGFTAGSMGEVNGGGYDMFMFKLDNLGQVLWLTQLGATTISPTYAAGNSAGDDRAATVTVDEQGDLYVAGFTVSSIGEVKSSGVTADAIVLKLDTNGNLVWVTQLGSETTAPGSGDAAVNNDGDEFARSIKLDNMGHVYVSGQTRGQVGGEAPGSSSLNDIFMMKLNVAGEVQWITQLGAVTKDPDFAGASNAGSDRCYGVGIDSIGNVYCTGTTTGSMGENNAGQEDLVVIKLNDAGVLQWITQLGDATVAPNYVGSSNSGNERSFFSLNIDASDNLILGGHTSGSMGEANAGGGNDLFVMQMSSSGILNWVSQLGDTTVYPGFAGSSNAGDDTTFSSTMDSAGNIYLSGNTTGDVGEVQSTGIDIFMAKLKPNGTF